MAKRKKKGELARVRELEVTPSRIRRVYGHKRDVGKLDRPRVLSYGGGVDSFAMLVAALERGEPPTDVVFADVTDPRSVTRMLRGHEPVWERGESPGEWPGTYRHLVEVAIPLMERHGIDFHWLTTEAPTRGWPWRRYARTYPILGGERTFGVNKPYTSLYRYFEDMRIMFTTSHMGGRVCTNAAKVRRIGRWVKETYDPNEPFEMWIGFDAEEIQRIQQDVTYTKSRSELPGRVLRYPLMEWGMCRCRCVQAISEAGFPVPRKSACTFCGYSTRRDWRTLATQQPETFRLAGKVEEQFKGTAAGKMLFFSGESKPRRQRGQARALPEFMAGWSPRTRRLTVVKHEGCEVCGAEVRATKATAVGWLDEPTPEEQMDPRPEVRAMHGLPPLPRGQMLLVAPPAHALTDEPMPATEEEIVASAFAAMLREENPRTGPALHWLLTA